MSDQHSRADTYRRRLYRAAEDDSLSFEETRDRILELGREFLGVDHAQLGRVGDGTLEVLATTGDPDTYTDAGDRFDRARTFCRRTVQKDTPLALSDADDGEWASDPAVEEHGLQCYLGATVSVDGEAFGTVWFMQSAAREEPFGPGEKAFVELVARTLGRELEAVDYERRLAERDRELRVKDRAIDEAPVGISIADATGSGLPLTYVNDEFTALTGYDREAVLGRNCRFLQGQGTDQAAIDAVCEALEAEEPVRQELLNYRADGTPFWNELTLAPVTDGSGETTQFVGFQHDVTERKRRERLVDVMNRVLRHNLRNRMTAVRGFAEWIRAESDGRLAEAARNVVDAADDLTRLGEKARTLDAAARSDADPVDHDLASVLGEVADRLRATYPDVTVTVTTTDARVTAHPRLPRALYELGENAAEHAGDDPSVRYEVAAAGDAVTVRVADDGPGLPAMERRVLHEGREHQTDHGRGLGLWLVNWIVTGSGGEVTAEATDDGTVVELRLPTGGEATALGGARVPADDD